MTEAYTQYCKDILEGTIPSGLHIINAVKRFHKDLTRSDLEFRPEAVNIVLEFCSSLKHFTGVFDGKPFDLMPWQQFIVANIYGFYWSGTDNRRYQTIYIEVARKNGKTALMAALSEYHLIADGEAGAEILLAANSKEQAKICFNAVSGYAKTFDPLEKYLKRYRADVLFPQTNSFIKVLASDSNTMDGYNCSLGVIDEYHSAPNSQVRDVIRSSQGMRKNPLLYTITTAGFDKSLPCYDLRTIATEIAAGLKTDDSFFTAIFSLDKDDNWKTPENWIKSNPNLDVTVNRDFIGKQVLQAINNPSDEIGVKTKNLNIWCDSATTWIPDEYIVTASANIPWDFSDQDCYIGVDLSSNIDLTAVAYLFVKDDIFHFFIDYYLPTDSLTRRADKELYRNWVNAKFLKTTAGNVTDYDYITRDILEMEKQCSIVNVYYDRYNATQWAIQCTDEGLPMTPFSQTIGNFNIPTKAFERLIMSNKVILEDNPITRFCIRNVEIRRDYNGNCKPNKISEKKKIDGVIAALQALAAYIDDTSKNKGTNIY